MASFPLAASLLQQSRAAPAGTSAAASAAAAPAAARLGGAAAVTISVPGVLLEESTARQLEESATVLPEAAGVLRELLAGGGRGPAVRRAAGACGAAQGQAGTQGRA
jgi:hypothetical protein